MSTSSSTQKQIEPRLAELAAKVMDDIRFRGLTPGDRYLTSEEAQRVFRVQKSLLNDAMRHLADREVLLRRRKSGTFVGPKFKADYLKVSAGLQSVHVVMAIDWYRTRLVPAELFVESINKVLPDAAVHIRYIPTHNGAALTEKIIEQMKSSGQKEGLVLIFSSHAVQQIARDSGLPVVNFGSVYPGIEGLACVEADQSQAGRLMARHVVSRGHQKFVFLTRNEWRRGDNLTLDGIAQELHRAQVSLDRLAVRSIAPDEDQVLAEIHDLLRPEDHPTAFICRSDFYADLVMRVATERKMNIDVVSGGHDASTHEGYAAVRTEMSMPEQIREMARMLAEQASGRRPNPEQVILPVELVQS